MMNEPFSVGIDLGGTRVKMGIVSNGIVVAKNIAAANSANGLQGYFPVLAHEINAMIDTAGFANKNLIGIGLAFPGIVNPYEKKILRTNNKYPDATQVDIGKWVNENWSVPCAVDNDASMAAVGEWKYGASSKSNDFVMMTIGTGIGSAAVINGKLLRGKHFQAGCLGGHFTINYTGEICGCGNRGCTEVYASSWCLKDKIMRYSGYAESLLSQMRLLDFEHLFLAAEQQDALAVQIVEDCLNAWSATVINLIHAYDPELVLLGGGVMKSAHKILPYIKAKVDKHAWCHWGKVEIQVATLEEDAAILGITHCLQHRL